jgi:hypothetical protein
MLGVGGRILLAGKRTAGVQNPYWELEGLDQGMCRIMCYENNRLKEGRDQRQRDSLRDRLSRRRVITKSSWFERGGEGPPVSNGSFGV